MKPTEQDRKTKECKTRCDTLSENSAKLLANVIASKTSFGMVEGISEGGRRLATALERYFTPDAPFQILIVGDVYITGTSMEAAKAAYPPEVHPDDIVGWVIFARTVPPPWINAVFKVGYT